MQTISPSAQAISSRSFRRQTLTGGQDALTDGKDSSLRTTSRNLTPRRPLLYLNRLFLYPIPDVQRVLLVTEASTAADQALTGLHTARHLPTPVRHMAHLHGRLRRAHRRRGMGTRSNPFTPPHLHPPRLSSRLLHRKRRNQVGSQVSVTQWPTQPREVLVSVLVRAATRISHCLSILMQICECLGAAVGGGIIDAIF